MVTNSENAIESEVSAWPGIDVKVHDRGGGHEFTLQGKEIGHMHGDRLVDIPFAKRIRDVLIEEARAQEHHVLPDSGWVSYNVRSDTDVGEALQLLRISYLYHLIAMRKRDGDQPDGDAVDVDAEIDKLDLSDELRHVFSEVSAAT